jgi:SAM-dependent methyltransferase
MDADRTQAADRDAMTGEQRDRWATVLGHLVGAIPDEASLVVVDGADGRAALLADRLAESLRTAGRPCVRLTAGEDAWRARIAGTVVIADGPRWRDQLPARARHLTIWVRTPSAGDTTNGYRGDDADAVVDLHDPAWPVIRHLDPWLVPGDHWYRAESQAFFAARAANWDRRFGDDLPTYAAAIAEARLAPEGVVVDVGCGTGRALPALRAAVGPHGIVIGLDLTPQMLTVARQRARDCGAALLLADASRLPFADASVDAVFAAGLITHLPDPDAGLRELARVTRPGGRLVLFHPTGRAALAARHGRTLGPDEPLADAPLSRATEDTSWELTTYDDPPHRFLAIATRR